MASTKSRAARQQYAIVKHTVDGFVHVTDGRNLPAILKSGFSLRHRGKAYGNTIGGIYLAPPSQHASVFTMISQSSMGIEQVAEISVRVHAGTRFCIDEDELEWMTEGGKERFFSKSFLKGIQSYLRNLDSLEPDSYEDLALRAELTCRMARALDQRHLHNFNIRVFDPPEILGYEVTDLE